MAVLLHLVIVVLACFSVFVVRAEDPYRFFTWTITYGSIAPLGVPQQAILVNGQFPGPRIDCQTNDNIIVNVINKIDQPFLLTWNGIKQRKSSWQDGVLGTNCPIPPASNFTYKMQMKDQIGTYTYFPSTFMHKAAGGFGGFNIYQRDVVPRAFPRPAADYTLLIGDWYKASHKELQNTLDSGKPLAFPDAILINGHVQSSSFIGDPGKTYMFRISNVGLSTSFNFRIQGHRMKLAEIEGSYTLRETYESLDVHVGQSMAVLVTLDQGPRDYYIVASTRFTKRVLLATATLGYSNSKTPASKTLPIGPTYHIHWSMKQARTYRWNLTASAARPNPQGSYHYGLIKTRKTLILANSATNITNKLRYAVNGVSYVHPNTPLKLADYFNIPGIFNFKIFKDRPTLNTAVLGTSVINATLHDFMEIIFQNNENAIQSWHLDGNDFWAVGYGSGEWTPAMRSRYNLFDAATRYTVQVYQNSWTAILVPLDNKGIWNLRSAIWPRQYLGQQLYIRVWNNEHSLYTEYDIPENALLCGKAIGRKITI